MTTASPPRAEATRGRVARLPLVVLMAGAVLLRIPALLADRHLGFDDGVYGLAALAMRAGEEPYRDIFCPQGPLFYPLVFVADLLGARALNAPRLLPLAAAAALTAATWAAGRRLRLPPPGAEVAAGLVATSGVVLWVTGPITGDGPALALATGAVALALAWRDAPSPARAAAVGVAMGAALSVKSLVIPAAVPVGWVFLLDGVPGHRARGGGGGGGERAPAPGLRLRHLAVAVAAAVAVGVVTTLPWGFANVWDNSVTYHLNAGTEAGPADNAGKVVSTLVDRDLPLLATGAGALALAAARRRRGAGTSPASGPSPASGLAPVVAWLAAAAVALVLKDPLWRNHISSVAPPAALLAGAWAAPALAWFRAASPARRAAVAAAGALVAAVHLAHVRPILWPSPPAGRAAEARAELDRLPDGAWAISDEPGLVWREGRRTPSYLVDASILRVRQERITAEILAREAADPRVCAVLVWSERYGGFEDLPDRLDGYREARRFGGPRVLYVKDECHPPGDSSAAPAPFRRS